MYSSSQQESVNYYKIKEQVLQVYRECKIRSFPIDCFSVLSHYGCICFPYSRLTIEQRNLCVSYSEDAFLIRDKLYYNDQISEGRLRFTLMHELGHRLMHQNADRPDCLSEYEANAFASHVLAPRIAMELNYCWDLPSVRRCFGLTWEAAQYALEDFWRWRRKVSRYGLSACDQSMMKHLRNKAKEPSYDLRELPPHNPYSSAFRDIRESYLPEGFEAAEAAYLYGDDY